MMKRARFQRKPPAPLEPVTRACSDERPAAMSPQLKEGDFICDAYRKFVRELNCLYAATRTCAGVIHPHHVRRRSSGVTDDRTCVALCAFHHRSVHDGAIDGPTLDDADRSLLLFIKQATTEELWAFVEAAKAHNEARIW